MEDKILDLDETLPLMKKFEADVFKTVFPNSTPSASFETRMLRERHF